MQPPNTLAALDQATRDGADVLEVDVQLTRDGALVLMHDDTLDRTTDMAGPVASYTLDQLRVADAGANDEISGRSFQGKGIGISTIDEAFARHPRARWIVELKNDDITAADALCEAIVAARGETRVMVASFYHMVMDRFRSRCPEVATSATSAEARTFIVAARLGLSRFIHMRAQALHIPEKSGGMMLAHPRIFAAAHQRGLTVDLWTINAPDKMRELIDRGADGIITDYVAHARQYGSVPNHAAGQLRVTSPSEH